VPVAITAFGADALERLRIDNLDDLQNVVPTLTVSQASGRPNAPVYSLRGIRPTEAIYGQDPTVAVYFADVVLSPAQGSNLGMYDLGSVQVLKGPQGTLFGRNTTGGAILLTPRRPGESFASDVLVGYGTYGLNETQLGIDMPLADTFRLRLTARTIDSEGYQTNVAPGPLQGSKLGGETTRSARLSAVWDITDSVENYAIFSWDDKRTNGRGTTLQAVNPNTALRCYDGPDNPNGECFPGESLPSIFDAVERARGRDVTDVESDRQQFDDIDVWGVVNTTSARLSDTITLKSIAGYRDFSTSQFFDIDASPIPGILTSAQEATLEHASYELQLFGTAFDALDWQTGLYAYYEDGVERSPGDVLQGLNPNTPIEQTGAVNNKSYSVFAQSTYRFTAAWSATVGARMTWDEKEMVLTSRLPSACSLSVENEDGETERLPLDRCRVELSDSFSQPTGTASVEYKPREGALLYLASRLGYRAGGFNLRADIPVEYEPFDPETVNDVELGAKLDWSLGAWAMRSNAALYHQWYDDIQRTVAVPNAGGIPGSAVQNAAEATVLGLELEQLIAPTENLSLQINYAYVDPEYERWQDPVTGADLTATPFFFTPEHSVSGTLTYLLPLGSDTGTLRFALSAAYRSETWINALQTITLIEATPVELRDLLKQDAYTLVDLSAGWTEVMGSAFDVLGYVKNLTDEEYKVGGVQLYPTFGLVAAAYGEPITAGVQLRYRF
jgi:iron complex outermembrane recepter protein